MGAGKTRAIFRRTFGLSVKLFVPHTLMAEHVAQTAPIWAGDDSEDQQGSTHGQQTRG